MVRRLRTRLPDYPPLWDAARWIIEAGHRSLKAAIRRELGAVRGRVLDVPCGTGLFSPLFPASGYTGVDASERYVERARRKHPGRTFRVGDARSLEFADATLEAVLVAGFLHHLDDPDVGRVLAEIRRVLKPGGPFLLVEDSPTRSRWNVAGRFLQSLDEGGRIRPGEWYDEALSARFETRARYPLRAGLWDYTVWRLV